MMVALGNLGTLRMIYQGFQRLAAPGGFIAHANIVQRSLWAIQGFIQSFRGGLLPFGRGDWYWFPSRVIPAANDVEPITEFPLFTFIYSDLHAHMIVLPLALLVLAWALSIVRRRAQMQRKEWLTAFLFAGLTVGAIYPTNLSDMYTYLLIAIAALAYAIWRYADVEHLRWLKQLTPALRKVLLIALGALALTMLSRLLYQPYHTWYSQAYGAIDPWRGSHTPISSYLTHWGLFLFVIVAWLIWETREWMAATPVSALARLQPYHLWIELTLALLVAMLIYFTVFGIGVGWLALPLAGWTAVLLLRPGISDGRRMALFLAGTAFSITLVVELVVARGDIGRMNTVFKFYLQAWTLFSVVAAAALGWLLGAVPRWLPRWQTLFQAGLTLLLAGTFLFTLSATTDKIADRMAPLAPNTLDSMTFMAYAQHWDIQTMDLGEDYRAIRWMQDHVQGSPVIVEANCTEYRWCSRFTIYTGLPGVVGWNWHQRQQRALIPPHLITDRVDAIGSFYATMDVELARDLLEQHNVRYIVVGQLERNLYPAVGRLDGLAKFEEYEGVYWRSVYRDASTVIYEVLPREPV
jgi:YYY domain-containing protein